MSVKQLPDGTWYYRFQYVKRSFRKEGFRTKRDAEEAVIVKKAEAQRTETYSPGYDDRLKLKDLADIFYKEYVLPYKRSWKGDRAMIRLLKDFFGEKRIKDITPRDVDAFRRYVGETVKVRFPAHVDRDSGPMLITVPDSCRSLFRSMSITPG